MNHPTRPHYPHPPHKGLSRRQFLRLMLCGTGGAATAAVCGGGGLLYLLLNPPLNQSDQEPQMQPVVSLQATQHHMPRPVIIPRASWGAREPDHLAQNEYGFASDDNPEGWKVYTDLQTTYNTVIIHHSVIYNVDDRSTLLEIQDLHRDDRQWADVAYHYFIGKSGDIYQGRPLNVRGVHVRGANTGTAGVCLLGNFMEEIPSEKQLQATHGLVQWLTVELQLGYLASHRAFNPETLCPGDNLIPYLNDMATRAGLHIGTEGYQPPASACSCSNCRI